MKKDINLLIVTANGDISDRTAIQINYLKVRSGGEFRWNVTNTSLTGEINGVNWSDVYYDEVSGVGDESW